MESVISLRKSRVNPVGRIFLIVVGSGDE